MWASRMISRFLWLLVLVLAEDATEGPSDPEAESQCHLRFNNDAGSDGGSNLGACQGDCDDDSDCRPGLKCKQRDHQEDVPGCFGRAYPGWDYCYDPGCEADPGSPPLDSSFGRHGSQNMPACAGDCDDDADCAAGLACFQRDGMEPVPGCSGRGVWDFDYCYNATVTGSLPPEGSLPPGGSTTQPTQPTTEPPTGQPCLCVFDIDRTLTGKQGTAGNQCPGDKEVHIWDTAYGGGWLTLSGAGQSLQQTFCDSCYLGVVSHGDASGYGSPERDYLLSNVLLSQPFSQLSASTPEAKVWSWQEVVSPLVLGWPDKKKQSAVQDIVQWYAQKGISIPAQEVYFFGDRTENIPPFAGTGFNAREISCDSRDMSIHHGMVGKCGATKDEIVKFEGVKTCGDFTQPTPPPAPSACLCVFDIDRTLTGKQGLAEGSKCPSNKIMADIWDEAYGGGPLTLSGAGQALDRTFCNSCFLGVVSAGTASGHDSALRRFLVSDVLRSGPFDDLRKTNPAASTWSSHWHVDSPLVLRSPNRWKQNAVVDILTWYQQQGISIPPEKVHFFGDRTENIGPFAWKGFNAREISCSERDYELYGGSGMVGLCGAALEEIVDTPGVEQCSSQRRLLV